MQIFSIDDNKSQLHSRVNEEQVKFKDSLATMLFRICFLPFCCQKVERLTYTDIIYVAVWYGFETWSFALKEEHRLTVNVLD